MSQPLVRIAGSMVQRLLDPPYQHMVAQPEGLVMVVAVVVD
jgi:hypothetical protein